MSVQTEIDRLETAKAAIGTAIAGKGVAVPSGTKLDGMAALINGIEQGSDPVLQSKTVSPTTSSQTVKPDSGYDGLSQVTVNAMPTATQATPSISVSSGGLITASATQSAGYVAAGTKKATKQLTVQAAQTITPGTSNKTISSGRYLTGTQTIKGDSNLVAGNIKNGVSIFGVAGTFEGSGGGSGGSQVATGTFTPAKMGLLDNPITITGIGFTPKIVFIRHNDGNASVNNTVHFPETGKYYFISGFKTAEAHKLVCYHFSENEGSRAIRTDRESYVFLDITEDGFTITTSRDNYYIMNRKYMYVAYG